MKLEIIGHRGASADAPENTIPAIKLAFEQGADGVEIDIKMTSDKKIVVFHDENTSRVSYQNKKIATNTLESLKFIDIGELKSDTWKQTYISTLEEMLAIIPNGKKVIIEFKCESDAIYELKNILSNFDTKNIVIASFNFKMLSLSKKEIPNVETYWIHDVSELDSYLTDWIIEKAKIENIDGLMINVDALDEDVVKLAHDENLKIYSWTVNSLVLAKQFSYWGLNGIITDKPGWIINQFKKTIVM